MDPRRVDSTTIPFLGSWRMTGMLKAWAHACQWKDGENILQVCEISFCIWLYPSQWQFLEFFLRVLMILIGFIRLNILRIEDVH